MKSTSLVVHHWLAKLNVPLGLLMVFLQRSPAVRVAVSAVDYVMESPAAGFLKSSLAAAAAMGGIHTIAGATELSPSTPSPAQLAVGTNANVAFDVIGTTGSATSWNVSGNVPPGMTFQGGKTSGTINVAVLTLSGAPTTAGNYSVNLVARYDPLGLSSPTFNYSFNVTGPANVAPSITTQPQSQIVTAGANVSFTGGADGTPAPTLQWRKNNVDIAGATTTTLTLNNVQAGDAASYTLVATNASGSATSNAATLTVNAAQAAPSFTTQPVSQVVTAGNPVTFVSAADGNPVPTYQWRKDGVNIGGATNSFLTLNNAQAGDAGVYTVVASNALGSVASSAATLTVNAALSAPAFSLHPATQTVTVGNPVTFTAAASGNPAPTYQWRKDGVDIGGANASTYTIAATVPGDAASYTVVATNSQGSATSNAAMLTVGVPPAFTLQPLSQNVTIAHPVTFTAAASGNPAPTYQWKKDGVAILGATNATFTIVSATLNDAGSYTVMATNGSGSIDSNPATLQVFSDGADFNNDGQTDVLWQNAATGQTALWLMNGISSGFTPAYVVNLGFVDPSWVIAGAGDFNHDGQADILWQNTATGQRALWLMTGVEGGFAPLYVVNLGIVDPAWVMAGTGDFNHDGQTDILWQNTVTGQRALWLMTGAEGGFQPAYVVNLGVVDTTWDMAGTGDFNNDGQADILWQNTATGQRALWLMTGAEGGFQAATVVNLGTVDTSWVIAGTGDFNNDGQADILWQNTVTGQRALWLMNGIADGFTPASIANLGFVDPSWMIAN